MTGSFEEPQCELMITVPRYMMADHRYRCPHPAAGHWVPVEKMVAALCSCCTDGLRADGVDVTEPLPGITRSWFEGSFGACP